MSKGRSFIISGPSGVGKSTVLSALMEERKNLYFSVSATTRQPRPGEEDGVHYHFLTMETFREWIDADAFVEYDFHNDTYYGTPKAQLEEKLAKGSVILDIAPVGAFNVRNVRPDATLIFINAPSMEELERRLRGRGDTSEEQMRMRLDRAAWEMEQGKAYDYIVINDQAQACADEIINIIAKVAGSV